MLECPFVHSTDEDYVIYAVTEHAVIWRTIPEGPSRRTGNTSTDADHLIALLLDLASHLGSAVSEMRTQRTLVLRRSRTHSSQARRQLS